MNALCILLLATISAPRPNFLIIFCDNLGYGDVGCFGSTRNRTPNLDRMAAEGLRLTSFYVTSGVCTPSRASLMTGCYPRRVSLNVNATGGAVLRALDRKGLNPSEITIAEVLRAAGYATACIGKWHLGDQPIFLPTRQGFDYYMMEQLQAVRSGKWKLCLALEGKQYSLRGDLRPSVAELYDVEGDPGETKNLAAEHAEVVARLAALADKARQDLGDRDRPGKNQRPAGWVEHPQPQVMRGK